VALFTSATNDAGGGTEVTGGSYARQVMAFDTPVAGATQNTSDVTFPTPTAGWGTITHTALFDAVTGGNMKMHGALAVSKTILTGEAFRFSLGDYDISVS